MQGRLKEKRSRGMVCFSFYSMDYCLDEGNERPNRGDKMDATRLPGIVLLTHGRVGEELIKSVEMIVGPVEQMYAVSLMPGMGGDEFAEAVSHAVNDLPAGSLIFSDLFGGTPANTAARFTQDRRFSAVAGVNLCMVLEAVFLRKELRGELLAEKVLTAGREGCKNIVSALQQANGQDKGEK